MSPAIRASIIVGVLYCAYWIIFTLQVPEADANNPLTEFAVINTAAEWTFKAVAYTLFARAVLGMFLNIDRPIVFFDVLRSVTDPFLVVTAPITPGFIIERLVPFYTAFLFFALGYLVPIGAFLLLRALS